MARREHFSVDKEGLAKLLRKRGVAFAVVELVQNALDERTAHVGVGLAPIPGTRRYRLVVADDNPDGFKDLSHAFNQAVIDFLIHEYAHDGGAEHLEERYFKNCTKLGAKATMLALSEPEFFSPQTANIR